MKPRQGSAALGETGAGWGGDEATAWREFLFHLHDMRRNAIGTFAFVLLLALLIAGLLPPAYQATAVLAVLPAPEYTVRPDAGSPELNNTALGLDQVMEAETELLDSDDLHEAALRRVGLEAVYPSLAADYRPGVVWSLVHEVTSTILLPWHSPVPDEAARRVEEALRRFRSHFTALSSKDANVITASFTHRDPTLAARVMDAMLAEYASRRSSLYDDPQLLAVRAAAEVGTRRLADAEKALAVFKQSRSIWDAATQRDLLLHRLSDAEQAAARANAVASEQKARLDALSLQLSGEPSMITVYQERDGDTRAQSLLQAVQDLRGRLAAVHGRYLETSRTVQDLNGQLSAREMELSRLDRDPSPSILRTGRNPMVDDIHEQRTRAAAEYAAALARRNAAAVEGATITAHLRVLDEDQVALELLQRQVASAAEAAAAQNRVLTARQLTEAEDSLRLAKVRVIQPARIPVRPGLLPLLVAAAGLLLAVVATAVRVAGSFMLRGTIWTPEGLTMATGLEILAVFPPVSDGSRTPLTRPDLAAV